MVLIQLLLIRSRQVTQCNLFSKTHSIISEGGAAFVCELSIGDEVISMNGMTVAHLSQDQIVELMTEAVRTGQLRLRVRRYNTITRKSSIVWD